MSEIKFRAWDNTAHQWVTNPSALYFDPKEFVEGNKEFTVRCLVANRCYTECCVEVESKKGGEFGLAKGDA